MSVTYTDTDYSDRDAVVEEAYVPVYARKRAARGRAGSGGVKTWMILAPLGLVVVGGVSAAMLMNGGGEAERVAAPAAPAPAVAEAPLTDVRPSEPLAAAPVAAVPEAAPAPVRRVAPVQRRAAPAAAVDSAAADDAGNEATAGLNRAQAAQTSAAPAPTTTPATPPAPTIEVQPFPGQ